MLSRLSSSEESSGSNICVRRAVHAILAVGATMLLASLQAQAQDAAAADANTEDKAQTEAQTDEDVTKLSNIEGLEAVADIIYRICRFGRRQRSSASVTPSTDP